MREHPKQSESLQEHQAEPRPMRAPVHVGARRGHQRRAARVLRQQVEQAAAGQAATGFHHQQSEAQAQPTAASADAQAELLRAGPARGAERAQEGAQAAASGQAQGQAQAAQGHQEGAQAAQEQQGEAAQAQGEGAAQAQAGVGGAGGVAARGRGGAGAGDAQAGAREASGAQGGAELVGGGKTSQGLQGAVLAPTVRAHQAGVGAGLQQARSAGVEGEYAFHELWRASSLGAGAGDYSTLGEPGSLLRFEAAARAGLEGGGRGLLKAALGGVTSLGANALQKGLKESKAVPFLGAVTTLTSGVVGLLSFDYYDAVQRVRGLLDVDRWEKDPFGGVADSLRTASNGVSLLVSGAETVLGLVRLVGALWGAETVLSKFGVAIDVLDHFNLSIKEMALKFRLLSVLTANGDARAVGKILKDLKAETEDLVGAAGAKAASAGGQWFARRLLKGARNSALETFGLGQRDTFDDGWASGANGLFKAGEYGLGLQQNQVEHQEQLKRWFSAQKILEDERKAVSRGDVNRWLEFTNPFVLVISPGTSLCMAAGAKVPRLAEAFTHDIKALPEAPFSLQGVGQMQAQLAHRRSLLVGLESGVIPDMSERAEGWGQEVERAQGLSADNQQASQKVMALQQKNDANQERHLQAQAQLAEAEQGEAALQQAPNTIAQLKSSLGPVLAGVEKIPVAARPAPLQRALVSARQVLGLKAGGEHAQRATQEKQQGAAVMQRRQQAMQEARGDLAVHKQRFAMTEQKAQEHQQRASQAQQEALVLHGDARCQAAQLRAQIQELEGTIQEQSSALDAWSGPHNMLRQQNDRVAEGILSGTPIQEGGIAALTPLMLERRDAAARDVKNCVSTLLEMRQRGAELKHQQGILLSAHAQAVASRIVSLGLSDCQDLLGALMAVSPESYTEVMARAADTTGRLRKRLVALPPLAKPAPACDPPKEAPRPVEEGSPQAPAPPPPPQAHVLFHHDAPRPGVLGSQAIASGGNLRAVIAWLRQFPGADVSLEAHASTEGSQPYNLRLAQRRGALVRQMIAESCQANISVQARGEGGAQEEGTADHAQAQQPKAYQHEPWRRVDVKIKPPSP